MSDKNNDQDNLDNLDDLHSEGVDPSFDDYESELEDLESEEESEVEDDEDALEFEDEEESTEANEEVSDEKPVKSKKSSIAPLAIIGVAVAAFSGIGYFVIYPTMFGQQQVVQAPVTPAPMEQHQVAPENKIMEEPVSLAQNVEEATDNSDFVVDLNPVKSNELVVDLNSTEIPRESNDVGQLSVTESNGELMINESVVSTTHEQTFEVQNTAIVEDSESEIEHVASPQVSYVSDPELVDKINSLTSTMESILAQNNSINVQPEIKYVETIVEVEKKIKRITNAEFEKLTSGRERLKGYQVIKTSKDGTMSIVKTVRPGKTRVSVFFKGEKMHVSGKGVQEITGIYDHGHLALVGNKWFMDEVYVKAPVVKKKKTTKTQVKTPSIKKKESNKDVVVVTPIKEESKILETAVGWVLNGIYNNSYLIETPTGEWLTKSNGDKLDGLGQIKGIDKNSNLIVGDYLVLLQKD